ncbi:AraC-type DNA-binding protein [Prevotellaceae bacterium MN60]|nr:AraC-type DNA-binding protein [Prevotellaceae bacterium MN60]
MVKNKKIVDTTLEQAREWGDALYLEDGLVLTNRISNAPIPQEPTRMNFILMALCRKGRAQYCIDTRQQTVKPGDLLFISERHIIDNYMASPDFECLCILVSTQFYHGFVQNVRNVSSLLLFTMNNPVVQLTPHEIQVYSNYYRTIREKISDTEHHYRTEVVKALLLAMFYDMSGVTYRVEQSSSKGQSRADVIFAEFIQQLEQNYRTERRVSWYAQQMGITPKYLSEIIKQISKRTPNEWIDSYVVLEIRVLLKNSTKSIKEITEELNFPNQSFLGKYFKEHVGMSPSEYRKK